MALFTAVFAAAAFLIAPVYRATVVAVPASADRSVSGSLGSAFGQLGGLASLAGINLGSGTTGVEESLAVLRSRQFTERFIDELHLLPVLYSRRWSRPEGGRKAGTSDSPTLAQAFKKFDEEIRSVRFDKKSGLVFIQIDWRDPAVAAQWANELVRRLNSEMRTRAITATSASVGYLQKALTETAEVEAKAAIGRLLEAQVNQRMYANVTREYALRVVDEALPRTRMTRCAPTRSCCSCLGHWWACWLRFLRFC